MARKACLLAVHVVWAVLAVWCLVFLLGWQLAARAGRELPGQPDCRKARKCASQQSGGMRHVWKGCLVMHDPCIAHQAQT